MKRIIIYTLIFFLIVFIPSIANAGVVDDVLESGNTFIESAKNSSISIDSTKFKDTSDNIYYILLYVGIVLSVIIGAILGIQIMIASAEDKAKVKESLIPYIIGCIVIFGSFGIWRIALEILNTI